MAIPCDCRSTPAPCVPEAQVKETPLVVTQILEEDVFVVHDGTH